MKKTLSIAQKFVIFVFAFSLLAVADFYFYMKGAGKLERYAGVNTVLSSMKSDILAIQYAVDIFIVAGGFEKGYGAEGIRESRIVLDRHLEQLEKFPFAAIFGANDALSREYHAFISDWKSAKERIEGIIESRSREESMLIHNDIDLKTFLIKERLERLDKFIYDEKTKAASDLSYHIIYGIILSAVIIFVIAYIFYDKTLKPIKGLIGKTEKMLIADNAATISVLSNKGDEIDALTDRLNIMADAIKMANAALEKDALDRKRELAERTKEFAALNRVAGLASRTLAKDEIIGAAIDELMLIAGADAGWVYLTEQQSGWAETKLHLNIHRGLSHTFVREAKEIKLEDSGIGGGQIRGKGHIIVNVADMGGRLRGLLQDMGFNKLCMLPIVYADSLLGIINMAGKGAGCFSGNRADSCAFAESMANEMAIAIEHTKLFQKEFKARQFLERIIHQSPVSIAVFDRKGVCVMLNAVCKRLFGIAHEDHVIGKYNLFEDNELKEKGYAHVVNNIFEGESVDMEIEYDISNVRHIQAKAGPKRLKIKAFPIADNDGSVSNVVLMHEDVTREYELKKQMLQAEKLSAISHLALGITHELNNPLRGIAGHVQFLKNNKEEDGLLQDTVAKIAREAERASIIVKNLLMFTREYKPHKSYVNINAVVSSALERKNHDIKGNNIDTVKEFTDSIPWTMADPSQLQQVFFNILDNAMDAIKDSRENGKIIVRTRHCKPGGDVCCSTCHRWGTEGVLVEFTDNGSGISEENQKKLFEPFFTTKPNGAGLGLSVSYGIIKEHGGVIRAKSKAGSGATFAVEIPVIKKDAAENNMRGNI